MSERICTNCYARPAREGRKKCNPCVKAMKQAQSQQYRDGGPRALHSVKEMGNSREWLSRRLV